MELDDSGENFSEWYNEIQEESVIESFYKLSQQWKYEDNWTWLIYRVSTSSRRQGGVEEEEEKEAVKFNMIEIELIVEHD